jgi:hypothetical protein
MLQCHRYASLFTLGMLVMGAIGHGAQSTMAQIKPPLVLEKNHTLSHGTFLGGVGNDQARGVRILSDGSMIVAGNFTNLQTRGAKISTLPGVATTAKGKLLKIAADGRILAELTLGNRVDDMDLKSVPGQIYQERVVVGGDFGVVAIQPSNMTVWWSKSLPEAAGNGRPEGQQTRVAISQTNQVVVLRAKTVRLLKADGTEKAKFAIDRDFVNDIAIEPRDSRIYVVGFANRFNANDINPKTLKPNPVQVPFLYAFNPYALANPTTRLLWKSWDYDPNLLTPSSTPGSAPQNNMADTRLYQVVVGGDGKPTVIGEAAGGNNVFRWNGKDFTTTTIVKLDPYSDTYNSASAHFSYYAKVNPLNGVVMAGQHAVPRLDSTIASNGSVQVGRANTFAISEGSLFVDAKGNMYIGGTAAYGIPDRAQNTFSGVPVAPYKPYDMVLLKVSADFRQRLLWTPFGREVTPGDGGGGGTLSGVAASESGKIVVLGNASFGNFMTTANGVAPIAFDPAGNDSRNDVYLGVLQSTP